MLITTEAKSGCVQGVGEFMMRSVPANEAARAARARVTADGYTIHELSPARIGGRRRCSTNKPYKASRKTFAGFSPRSGDGGEEVHLNMVESLCSNGAAEKHGWLTYTCAYTRYGAAQRPRANRDPADPWSGLQQIRPRPYTSPAFPWTHRHRRATQATIAKHRFR